MFYVKVLAVVLYSFFVVNFLDNVLNPVNCPGWHLILIGIYAVLPLFLSRNLREFIMLFIVASLVNDLTYALFRNIFLNGNYDLYEWYMWQFGMCGFKPRWTADFMFFKVRVSSVMMGAWVWLRILSLLTILIFYRKRF